MNVNEFWSESVSDRCTRHLLSKLAVKKNVVFTSERSVLRYRFCWIRKFSWEKSENRFDELRRSNEAINCLSELNEIDRLTKAVEIADFWSRMRRCRLQRNEQRKLQLHWATSNVDEEGCERSNQFTNSDADFDVDVDEELLLTKTVSDARRQNEQIDLLNATTTIMIVDRLIDRWICYN